MPDMASKYASTGRENCSSPENRHGQSCQKPRERDNEKPLSHADAILARGRELKAGTAAERDRTAGDERPHGLRIADRHGHGDEEGEGQILEHRTDEVQGRPDVYPEPATQTPLC